MKWSLVLVGAVTTLAMSGCSGKPSPDELARKALEAPTVEEQERAATALADLGVPALPQIRELAVNPKASLPVKLRMMDAVVLARDWDSMPMLLTAMESDSIEIRGRATSSVMALLGARFNFPVEGSVQARRQAMQAVRAAYEKMRDHPPPGYHTTGGAAAS
ncbi:MAG: hypothetical protein NTW96_17490 [Planctomycetia bacterium]|nr:hypothetical protein [Planctomycetia bacterium]